MTRKKKNVVSSEWSLADIYHHVLKQSSSPEAAKIVISEAWKNGRLPLYCERREYKASPAGLTTKTPVSPAVANEVVSNYQIVDEHFSRWDWERSYAIRTDPKTKSLFEYRNIHGFGDAVLTIWPPNSAQPPQRRGPPTKYDWHVIDGEIARRCIDPKTRTLKVPKNESPLVDAVLEWCEVHTGVQPAPSGMHEAVKAICAALRTV
ncbi:MAG: hypothetical protein WA728_37430 [Xanthobacteraceae bacterium]